MPIDVAALWDYRRPAESEERFLAALATADRDDGIILRTQIARTWGLRGDFDRARQVLAGLESLLEGAGAEARARHALELGRTHVSTTHPEGSLTAEAKALARAAYQRAIEIAHAGGLDALAIDAMHMMVLVDTMPEDQLRWNRLALSVAEGSSQPSARRWEGSLRNNMGCAWWEMGRNEEALAEFERALACREREGSAEQVRIARWMIAKTLRLLGRADEALAMQEDLERQCEEAGEPDPYVFEELELLHRAAGRVEAAQAYASRRGAQSPPP